MTPRGWVGGIQRADGWNREDTWMKTSGWVHHCLERVRRYSAERVGR